MKRRLLIVLVAVTISVVAVGISLAQQSSFEWRDTFADSNNIASSSNIAQVLDSVGFGTTFTPYAGNPLSTLESSDPWDAGSDITRQIPGAVHPDVLYFPDGIDGYKFWMVFTPLSFEPLPPGVPPAPNPGMAHDWWWERPTLVRSNDGIHWEKTPDYTNPIVNPGAVGDWDDQWLADPDFVYAPGKGPNGESWFLYYTGCGAGGCHIALAMSQDGKHYTKHPSPVSPAFRCPAVIYNSTTGIFHMWYNWGSYDIGYATSTDGINWTPYNPTNPGQWGYLVYTATPGTYDQGGVSHMDVISFTGQYHMYTLAMPTASYAGLVIGHLTSTDGAHWTQVPTPALTPGTEAWHFWNGPTTTVQSFYRPSVVLVTDTLYLYYGGTDTYSAYPATHYDLGLAFSQVTGPDGHVELTRYFSPTEYLPKPDTVAWYHMNEGPSGPTYPGEYLPKDSTSAWYHFNEGTGTTTLDSGGVSNDTGTLNGATWTSGLYGNGLQFNGSASVTAPHSDELNADAGITIEAWVNPAVNKSNNYVAIKMTSGGGDYAYGLKLENSYTSGYSEIGALIQDSAGHLYFAYGGNVPVGQWTHIAMTYQVGDSHLRLFQNGVEVTYRYGSPNAGTDSIPAGTHIRSNTGPLHLGVIPVGGGLYFNGRMDEVRITGNALTPAEIAADGTISGLNPTVIDSSGNGNHGTPLNGAAWSTGLFSYGMDFNPGYVNIPYASSLDTPSDLTIEAWINLDSIHDNSFFVARSANEPYPWSHAAYGFKVDSAGLEGWIWHTEPGFTGEQPYFKSESGMRPQLGAWNFVAMTYQASEKKIHLYLNGAEVPYSLQQTVSDDGHIDTPAGVPLTLGHFNLSGNSSQPVDGRMDEVRILSRALTQAEVLVDYGSGYHAAGSITSILITPPADEAWDRFYATDNRPQGTSITYSVLDANGQVRLSPVSDGASIASLGSMPVRLHAQLTTTNPMSTPLLQEWRVTSTQLSNPPPLPSRFYGEIHIEPAPQVGDRVQVLIGGVSRAITTAIASPAGTLTYQIDVPGDVSGTPEKEGGAEGEVITFTLGSRVVATGVWHSGTNTRLDFHSHSVTLQPGWNLASFNLRPVSTAITDVLSSLAGQYDLVYAWNAPSQQWLKYDDVAMSQDTLLRLDERSGFWLHLTTTAQTLTVYGSLPMTTDISLSGAGSGWNLVGYPSSVTRALPAALSDHGVGTDFSLVYAYRPIDLFDPWKLFDRNATYSNDLTVLSPGWGYWIQATTSCTWSVVYSEP